LPWSPPCCLIVSEWKRTADGTFDWQITVPANSTATVYIPTADAANVTESGKPIRIIKNIIFLHKEAGAAVYKVGSGSYRFQSKLFESSR
jgi:alpha-L-rhamnosidase